VLSQCNKTFHAVTCVRNHLSIDSTHALLFLGAWSKLNIIKPDDVLEAARLPDAKNDEGDGWDIAIE
jgi:hypothetical protein